MDLWTARAGAACVPVIAHLFAIVWKVSWHRHCTICSDLLNIMIGLTTPVDHPNLAS